MLLNINVTSFDYVVSVIFTHQTISKIFKLCIMEHIESRLVQQIKEHIYMHCTTQYYHTTINKQ